MPPCPTAAVCPKAFFGQPCGSCSSLALRELMSAAVLHSLWPGSSLCWGDHQLLPAVQQKLVQRWFCSCSRRLFRLVARGWRRAAETPATSPGQVRRQSCTDSQPQLIFCSPTDRCFDHIYFKFYQSSVVN